MNYYMNKISKIRIIKLMSLLMLIACSFSCSQKEIDEKPITILSGDLKVSLIDNDAYGELHRNGYNGISELRHAAQDSTLFAPFYAGFNLEHIFAGDSLSNLFEPRRFPMKLKQISENVVELYQSETPQSHVESWTTFTLVPPHYIDVNFRCIIKSDAFFKHGYAGIFWASYINAPQDKKIYFYGREKQTEEAKWMGAYSTAHGVASTHIGDHDKLDLFAVPGFNVTLASHYSDYLFSEPFYYGRFNNMVFAYLFSQPNDGIIRFSQSPTGGGQDNPAWDFQFIIPNFEVDKEYSYNARLLYKEWKGAKDIKAEYNSWNNN